MLHNAHLGVDKCKRRAKDVPYWPGVSAQIEDKDSNCQMYAEYRKTNHRESLLPHDTPQQPWGQNWWWPLWNLRTNLHISWLLLRILWNWPPQINQEWKCNQVLQSTISSIWNPWHSNHRQQSTIFKHWVQKIFKRLSVWTQNIKSSLPTV